MNRDLIKLNVSEYLERIGCELEFKPTVSYLKKLHRQHLLNIPFENLDNFLGNQVILDLKRIYKKIVLNKRGGFCFELNGLFYYLLKSLGFKVKIISARPFSEQGDSKPEFDHMAMLVYFPNEVYLVDVGFGIFFRSPLLLKPGQLQMDYNRYFKIEKNIDDVFTLSSSYDTVNFSKEYSFIEKERALVEFIDMCEFHNRNKKSHLMKRRFVTQARKNGQVTLTDKKLTLDLDGKHEEFNIHNFDEFRAKLSEHFHIK